MIGAVIQHLDFEPIQRVIDLTGMADDPLGHLVFVEHRQLDGNPREHRESALRLVDMISVLQVEIDQDISMEAVQRNQKEHRDVNGNEPQLNVVSPLHKFVISLASMPTSGLGQLPRLC